MSSTLTAIIPGEGPSTETLNYVNQSLLDDPVFQAFYTVISNDNHGKRSNCYATRNDFPDPQRLLNIKIFRDRIVESEPGKRLDYDKIRKVLETVQRDTNKDSDSSQDIFDQCNDLLDAHTYYVQTITYATVYEMYDRMIDRLFGKVQDDSFETLVSANSMVQGPRYWSTYEEIKASNFERAMLWRDRWAAATQMIKSLKVSSEFNNLLVKLKTAVDHAGDRPMLRGPAIEVNIDQRLVSQARVARSQRKVAIEQRNRSAEQARVTKNHELKARNIQNVHQLGNSSRISIPESVIYAISDIHEKYNNTLFMDDGDSTECKKELESTGTGTSSANLAMKQMNIKKDCKEEPLDGMIIPYGFVHLGSGE